VFFKHTKAPQKYDTESTLSLHRMFHLHRNSALAPCNKPLQHDSGDIYMQNSDSGFGFHKDQTSKLSRGLCGINRFWIINIQPVWM